MEIVFYEIAGFLLAAAAIGLIGAMLRQPVIVSFIAVGILAAALFESAPRPRRRSTFWPSSGSRSCCSSWG